MSLRLAFSTQKTICCQAFALDRQNLSGTSPKARGPRYLPRFTTEKAVTANTTVAGNNVSLSTLGD